MPVKKTVQPTTQPAQPQTHVGQAPPPVPQKYRKEEPKQTTPGPIITEITEEEEAQFNAEQKQQRQAEQQKREEQQKPAPTPTPKTQQTERKRQPYLREMTGDIFNNPSDNTVRDKDKNKCYHLNGNLVNPIDVFPAILILEKIV